LIAIALILSATPTVFADPIQIKVSRSAFGFVSFEDLTTRGASEIDGTSSATAGTFATNQVVTARTDLASLSVIAAQNTQFDAVNHRLSGSGSVSTGNTPLANIFEVDMSEAASDVNLAFTLSRATPFRLSGLLTAADDGIAQLSLGGPEPQGVNFGIGSGSINFSRSGILQPGEHLFFTRAAFGEGIPTVTARAAFNIDFQLGQAATPEPASLTLLAIGIVAAGFERSRRAVARTKRCA
jgi:hypothetical protein